MYVKNTVACGPPRHCEEILPGHFSWPAHPPTSPSLGCFPGREGAHSLSWHQALQCPPDPPPTGNKSPARVRGQCRPPPPPCFLPQGSRMRHMCTRTQIRKCRCCQHLGVTCLPRDNPLEK